MDALLQEWLALACPTISGVESGVVVIGASENAPTARRAAWPAAEAATPRLLATLSAALARGEILAQTPTAAAGGLLHVAVPVAQGGAVRGAVAVAVRGAAPADAKPIAERLGCCVRLLARLLDAAEERERLADALGVATSLLEHDSLPAGAHALAAHLARELGCERVAVGLRGPRGARVVALSSSARFASESDAVGALAAAMDEAIEQDAVLELPAAPDGPLRVRRAQEDLARSSGAASLATVPLACDGRGVGALVFEWSGDAPATLRARASELALLGGPLLALLERAEAGVLARLRAGALRRVERHFGADHSLAKIALAAAAAVIALVAIVPAPYRVAARATLEGRVQRALVAGVGGYIAEAHARAGDVVEAGAVLATLDDRDLQLERRKHESERGQLENEYRQALAAGDRTQVSILRARIEAAAASLGLVEEELARTRVVAPFAGIVLSGDLHHSLGSPVERGELLFEIAPLDGYRIIVEVEGRDVADVAAGQRGRLALSALPGRTLPLVVERIAPISTTRDGRSFFRAEAALVEPLDALRPGMEGVAKIEAGRRGLLWIWTHGLLDWLRLAAWSVLP